MELARTEYYLIERGTGAGIVSLTWTEETAEMNDVAFREGHSRLGAIASEYRPAAILVNVANLRFTPGPTFEQWHHTDIVPKFNHAGLKKLAIAWGEGRDVPPDPYRDPAEKFKTRHFATREQARDWLLSY